MTVPYEALTSESYKSWQRFWTEALKTLWLRCQKPELRIRNFQDPGAALSGQWQPAFVAGPKFQKS